MSCWRGTVPLLLCQLVVPHCLRIIWVVYLCVFLISLCNVIKHCNTPNNTIYIISSMCELDISCNKGRKKLFVCRGWHARDALWSAANNKAKWRAARADVLEFVTPSRSSWPERAACWWCSYLVMWRTEWRSAYGNASFSAWVGRYCILWRG